MAVILEGVKIRRGSIYPAWYAMEDRHQITRQEAAERLGVGVDSLRSSLSDARARGLPVDKRPPGGDRATRGAAWRAAVLEDMEFIQENHPDWTSAQIGARLGVSERTIQRLRKGLATAER